MALSPLPLGWPGGDSAARPPRRRRRRRRRKEPEQRKSPPGTRSPEGSPLRSEMSPPGGRRCPPALLALLLGLAGSRGSPECQNRAVTEGGSLCLVPEEPPGKWTEIHWKWDINSGALQKILTARRGGNVSYPRGLFHGRATFQPGNLSLCISPVGGADNGVYRAEFETSGAISARCFRVSVWEPVPQPELKSQILERARGWCRLALLCSSPGNVSYSWACAGEIPGQIPEETPGVPSQLLRSLPEGTEPQICLCNVSNPAGWSAARARLTCPEIPGNFGHWTLLAVGVAVGLTLLLVGGWWWRRRKRRKNSREGPPGTPPEQAVTIYATVGEKKPRQDPAGAGEATQEGATIYAVVTPRTLEHPKHQEEPGNFTIYSTVQFERRPSSIKRKRLERSLVSTAYVEDHGGYRSLGFPNPAGHQRP